MAKSTYQRELLDPGLGDRQSTPRQHERRRVGLELLDLLLATAAEDLLCFAVLLCARLFSMWRQLMTTLGKDS